MVNSMFTDEATVLTGKTLLSMGFALFVLELTHSELDAESSVTAMLHCS